MDRLREGPRDFRLSCGQPAVDGRQMPEMAPAAGLARKCTASATSFGSTIRCKGYQRFASSKTCALRPRVPPRPACAPSPRHRIRADAELAVFDGDQSRQVQKARLAALYAGWPKTFMPFTEAMLTTEPPPLSGISSTARKQRKAASRLSALSMRQMSCVVSCRLTAGPPAALSRGCARLPTDAQPPPLRPRLRASVTSQEMARKALRSAEIKRRPLYASLLCRQENVIVSVAQAAAIGAADVAGSSVTIATISAWRSSDTSVSEKLSVVAILCTTSCCLMRLASPVACGWTR